MLFKFTVKWFQNHIQGKSPHPGQDKFDFRKTEQALEWLSLMVIGVNASTIIMTLLLLRPMASDFHAEHLILVGSACGLYASLSASSAIVILKILKGYWSRKAFIVFTTIIFSIALIFVPKENYWEVVFVRQVSFAGHRSQVAGHRSQVTGCRSQVKSKSKSKQ